MKIMETPLMKIIETPLPGVIILEPKVFGDQRGFFMETWSQERYCAAGIKEEFVQDNMSSSSRGTLRGLHFQHPQGQGKLVQALSGAIFDAVVDIRVNSPSFGQWFGTELNAEKRRQMYIPPGFAHGFCVLSDIALFSYKCTDYYNPQAEGGILWNDPDIGIDWPFEDQPVLSDRDQHHSRLSEVPVHTLPHMEDYA
jgi:dTDP-4-dehydrorhamnose 3,5-epimerase